MKNFNTYLLEDYGKGGLTIFDIDDTLFHTTAKIDVIKNGKKIRELTNQEYNTHKLKPGEEYDFKQFRDAKKFREESKPIRQMFAKAKSILRNVANKQGSRVIILTARDDFDDRETFLNTFRDYGFDIDKVRVERAGKIRNLSPEYAKYVIVYNYLKQGAYSRVRLFDDSKSNLKQFLNLKKQFPKISFEAYFVNSEGNARKITTVNEEVKSDILPKSGAGQDGTDTLVKNYMKSTPGQSYKKFKAYLK
jgi:hypothetical protein